MSWWQYLLFPFAILYNLVTRLRNHLYNIEYSEQYSFDRKIISIGNLEMGGTGKTPMVDYLLKHFHQRSKLAVLSRGYYRNTKGFRMVKLDDSAKEVGDEMKMLFDLHHSFVAMAVGEDRVLAIPELLFHASQTEVILLDDGFQQRSILQDLSILLTRYDRPFYGDFVLPAGRLRESRSNASRADIIMVTKCPVGVPEYQMKDMRNRIYEYAPDAKIYFTRSTYGDPVHFAGQAHPIDGNKVILVSGIAHGKELKEYVESQHDLYYAFQFRDHHRYREEDIGLILDTVKSQSAALLTTHKDAVKLLEYEELKEISCYYLPVSFEFLNNEEQFLSQIEQCIQKESGDLPLH